jgi:hypothetical protein
MHKHLGDVLFATAPLHIMTAKRRETSMNKIGDFNQIPSEASSLL